MRTAILYIAERCNQKCVFCLEEDRSWSEFTDPSTAEVYGVLDRLFERGARQITFMGGETFFRKDLPPILTRAKEVGFRRIGVTTNGTVLSKPGFIDRLVAAGLDFIELSIHGHDAELANAIARNKITFDRQTKAMAEINGTGSLLTIVNVVVCRENKDHLAEVAEYVCDSLPDVPLRFKFKFVSLQGWALERVRKGVEKALSYEEVDFGPVGDLLEARGVDFWIHNVPLCHLGRHAGHAHELGVMAADETYFDLDHRGPMEYYDTGHQLEGRIWPKPPCPDCSLIALCPGIEESYRLANGTGELRPRSDDPLELMRFALADRGLDPADAEARLAAVREHPRPSLFVRDRPDGALRFVHAEEELPFDIMVDRRGEEDRIPGFAKSERFVMHYRLRTEDDRETSPRMLSLLEAAAAAMREADAAGHELDETRAMIVQAATGGWVCDLSSTAIPRPVRKRSRLPVIQPEKTG